MFMGMFRRPTVEKLQADKLYELQRTLLSVEGYATHYQHQLRGLRELEAALRAKVEADSQRKLEARQAQSKVDVKWSKGVETHPAHTIELRHQLTADNQALKGWAAFGQAIRDFRWGAK